MNKTLEKVNDGYIERTDYSHKGEKYIIEQTNINYYNDNLELESTEIIERVRDTRSLIIEAIKTDMYYLPNNETLKIKCSYGGDIKAFLIDGEGLEIPIDIKIAEYYINNTISYDQFMKLINRGISR